MRDVKRLSQCEHRRMSRFTTMIGMAAAPLVAISGGSPAFAQRSDDNAIAHAEVAFGSNDGGEVLGIYNPTSVRGFSPIDAGNVRLEGWYFDSLASVFNRPVVVRRIRVGSSSVGYERK